METIPLEMDDIFDETEEDVMQTRLPDLEDLDLEEGLEPMRDSRYDDEGGEQAGDDPVTDNPELLNKLKSLKGASKNTTKRSYIKLDATRLTGERGIPVLPKIFKDVKLKGKHHEIEDLKTIMHKLEHWAHRLFPKMTFSEVLERAERLGAKKEVQTCVKRIRLGMSVLPSDEAENEENVQREGDNSDEAENEENVQREGDNSDEAENEENVQREGDNSDKEDEDIQRAGNADSAVLSQIPNDDEIDELLNTEMEMQQEASQVFEPKTPVSESSQQKDPTENNLTEEARLRIERNKKLALERRAARLAKANNTQDATHVVDSVSLSQTDGQDQPTSPVVESPSLSQSSNQQEQQEQLEPAAAEKSNINDDKDNDCSLDVSMTDNTNKESESNQISSEGHTESESFIQIVVPENETSH